MAMVAREKSGASEAATQRQVEKSQVSSLRPSAQAQEGERDREVQDVRALVHVHASVLCAC